MRYSLRAPGILDSGHGGSFTKLPKQHWQKMVLSRFKQRGIDGIRWHHHRQHLPASFPVEECQVPKPFENICVPK